jgi:tRNA-2-methylthio-N6-dimethylallyladenosine synthase
LKRKPSIFIETYGCQMNKNDSELIRGILQDADFRLTGEWTSADIVLLNTCSVREHAEQRVLGRIGVLAGWKRQSPGRRIGVLGCMAQRLGGEWAKLKPCVDFVVGPDGYRTLPELLSGTGGKPVVAADFRPGELYSGVRPVREPGATGWVTISRGCDNFCSYCIVPYARGPERSRPSGEILREIGEMTGLGFREVTLLGQNVNSYADGSIDFPGLLESVSRIPGLLRVRFMTSHPKDLSDRLLGVMASGGPICPHIHLPVQSGSDRVLEMMNRGYTAGRYLERVRKARERMPSVSLTTDVMVGYPGESETDFQDTMKLVEEVRFDEAYTYAYSPRSGTAAAGHPGTVPEDEKFRRLGELIDLQRSISVSIRRAMVGTTVEVFPEKPSARSDDEWMGRTPGGHVVVFGRDGAQAGHPARVLLESCSGATLRGRVTRDIPHETVREDTHAV